MMTNAAQNPRWREKYMAQGGMYSFPAPRSSMMEDEAQDEQTQPVAGVCNTVDICITPAMDREMQELSPFVIQGLLTECEYTTRVADACLMESLTAHDSQ